MSTVCPRCSNKFISEKKLRSHLRSEHPCDFICNKCGNQLYTKNFYFKHLKSNCEYVPSHKPTEQDYEDHNKILEKEDKMVTTNMRDMYNGDVTNNNFNIKIDKIVVTPHTEEMKIDKEKLLGEIMEKILFRLDIGASGKANWGTLAFTDSFQQIFEHIYANKDYPEQQNLFLKDLETRELQIFDGEKFVDDKLSTEERMLKILYFIGDGLKWMVEKCDTYTPEFKEEKKQQISRVLVGIPKFKVSYRAMFDNMFNTLKDVREHILERSVDDPLNTENCASTATTTTSNSNETVD